MCQTFLLSEVDFFTTFMILGIMKLQPAIFRPREVVKHVLQNASSFMKKELTLEGCIDDDVPSEVLTIIHIVLHAFCLY